MHRNPLGRTLLVIAATLLVHLGTAVPGTCADDPAVAALKLEVEALRTMIGQLQTQITNQSGRIQELQRMVDVHTGQLVEQSKSIDRFMSGLNEETARAVREEGAITAKLDNEITRATNADKAAADLSGLVFPAPSGGKLLQVSELQVFGPASLQGGVTIGQAVTISGAVSIKNDLAITGNLSGPAAQQIRDVTELVSTWNRFMTVDPSDSSRLLYSGGLKIQGTLEVIGTVKPSHISLDGSLQVTNGQVELRGSNLFIVGADNFLDVNGNRFPPR